MNRQPPTKNSLVSHSSRTVVSGVDPGGFDSLGDNGDPVVINRKEAAVYRSGVDLTRHGLDPDVAADQDPEQRCVTWQDSQLAFHRARDNLLGFALPDLPVCGNELDMQLTHGFLLSQTYSLILTGINR
jgi:hypothetical protein